MRQRVDLRTALWGSASLFVVVATLVLPSPAEAGRGFAVYSYGEAITPIGEVAEEHRERVKRETGTNPSVGFIYSALSILWLDLWTWNGRYCLFEDDQFWDLDEETAASFLGRSPGTLGKPFFYRFPPALLALVGFAGIPYAIYTKARDARTARERRASGFPFPE